MSTVTSPDGTVIDCDRYGDAPAVIFIGGASAYRATDEGSTQTARSLAAGGYTAVDYDRSGRGRSGDTQPWALDREVEDVAELIKAAGGAAALCTNSSGGGHRYGGRHRRRRCHRSGPLRAAVLRRPKLRHASADLI
jgi:pimeloyl-ACP methyl ester carboxylesterase